MLMVDDDDEDEDEPSYAEEADALLAQMRQLRESMQQQSGILQQKAQASEQERTTAQQNLGRTVASIVDDVANVPSLLVDVANGRWADAELQPAPAAVGGARSVSGGPSVAGGADGPSDAHIVTSRRSSLVGERWQAACRRMRSRPAGTALPCHRRMPGRRHLRRGSRAQVVPRAVRRPASRPSRVAQRPPVPTISPRSEARPPCRAPPAPPPTYFRGSCQCQNHARYGRPARPKRLIGPGWPAPGPP